MISELARQLHAEPSGVITDIGEGDEMYRPDRHDVYFRQALSALRCIRLALLTAGKREVHSLLDFPCGHGRVLRMLKAEFPDAKLTAGDINEDGVDFCERVFGAKPIYSAPRAKDVEIHDQFDLIWCGSLLTHLDLDRWEEFFNLLADSVAERGLFVFTAFGNWAASRLRSGEYDYNLDEDGVERILAAFDQDGFGYSDYPGQALSGMSLTSPEWLLAQLAAHPELRLVSFMPRGWGRHQDVLACVKQTSVTGR
jgi:SAM-dependent methyltransferase